MRRIRRPRLVRASAILAVPFVVLGAACGDPSAEPAANADADGGPALLEEGTPLADGFTVPVGSVALNLPMPAEYSDPGASDWGVTLVPSDAVVAANELAAQAAALGFDLSSFDPGPCTADDHPDAGSVQTQWPLPTDQPAPRSVACSISGLRTDDGVARRLLIFTSQEFGDAPSATAGLSVAALQTGAEATPYGVEYTPIEIAPVPDSYPRPAAPPSPPKIEVGGPLVATDPALTGGWAPRLVAGSRLVVPAQDEICQGGFRAMLDITGDPDEVMAGYVTQLRAWSAEYGGPPRSDEMTSSGRRVLRSVASIDGTSLVAVMVVGNEGEPTRMRYETCSG